MQWRQQEAKEPSIMLRLDLHALQRLLQEYAHVFVDVKCICDGKDGIRCTTCCRISGVR